MRIELDENWNITNDTYSWKLEFTEERQRDKVETVKGKRIKTGEKEDYLFTDAWYYPKIRTCLETYLEKSAQKSKTVEEMNNTLKRIHNLIDNLKGDTFIPCK